VLIPGVDHDFRRNAAAAGGTKSGAGNAASAASWTKTAAGYGACTDWGSATSSAATATAVAGLQQLGGGEAGVLIPYCHQWPPRG
jgi:hypothetical protein